MKKKISLFLVCFSLILLQACTKHNIELEVKPMYIKIDINIKADEALDNYFSDIDNQDITMQKGAKK